MRSIFVILLLCGFVSAAGLKECQSDADKIDGCVAKGYHENGNLKYEIPYKNGKEEGVEKQYYENGNLWGEIPYKNGEQDGVAKSYHENGNLMVEHHLKNGKLDGVSKWYYKNGNLEAEIPYENDKAEGTGGVHREDGSLYVQLTYSAYSNGEVISGKCGDGKNLTNAHLHNINQFIRPRRWFRSEIAIEVVRTNDLKDFCDWKSTSKRFLPR